MNFLSHVDPSQSVAEAIASDFSDYSVIGVNRIIVDGNVAFAETRVTFHADKLEELRQMEADSIKGKLKPLVWGSQGGDSYDCPFESGGSGLATFYFVKQHGMWKNYMTYFSSKAMNDSDMAAAAKSMKTLYKP